MARRNRAEVVVEDEIEFYHCIQRVVRRAFLCEVDPLRTQSFEHRKDWIRDRLEALAGLFGVEIAAFAVLSNHRVQQGHQSSSIPGGRLAPFDPPVDRVTRETPCCEEEAQQLTYGVHETREQKESKATKCHAPLTSFGRRPIVGIAGADQQERLN